MKCALNSYTATALRYEVRSAIGAARSAMDHGLSPQTVSQRKQRVSETMASYRRATR